MLPVEGKMLWIVFAIKITFYITCAFQHPGRGGVELEPIRHRYRRATVCVAWEREQLKDDRRAVFSYLKMEIAYFLGERQIPLESGRSSFSGGF